MEDSEGDIRGEENNTENLGRGVDLVYAEVSDNGLGEAGRKKGGTE